MASWLFASLLVLMALLIGGVVSVLLRYSAEEERRAAEHLDWWRDWSSTHRQAPKRGPWKDDDAA